MEEWYFCLSDFREGPKDPSNHLLFLLSLYSIRGSGLWRPFNPPRMTFQSDYDVIHKRNSITLPIKSLGEVILARNPRVFP